MSRRALVAVSAGAALLLALLGTVAVAMVTGGAGSTAPWSGGWARLDSACPAPSGPGQMVTFVARDMGRMGGGMMRGPMAAPMMLMPVGTSVPAGTVTVVLVNAGRRPHELLVLPLGTGQVAGQRPVGADDRVSEAGLLGEAEATCPTGTRTDDVVPGGTGQVTLDLAPGRYEVVCNLPGHYRSGMYATLTVT